jgi:beta-mannanase
LELLEARLGRRLDIDRAYYAWDDPIPTGQEVTDVAMGRITLLSWKAQERDGRALSWSGIASGAQDRWIVARARAFKAFAHPVMLAFHHEPENDVATNGTPEEFAAAFRHVHDVFVREGADNVVWVVVLFAFTYSGPRVAEFYPGDGFVDWVGGDGFNFYGTFAGPGGCSRATWRPFSEIFSAMVAFARARGKPAVAAEWASAVDPQRPARKAAWLREAHATITSWPTLKAVVTFDADRRDSSGCDWRPSTSAEAWDAFKSMAIDPALDVLEARASP